MILLEQFFQVMPQIVATVLAMLLAEAFAAVAVDFVFKVTCKIIRSIGDYFAPLADNRRDPFDI